MTNSHSTRCEYDNPLLAAALAYARHGFPVFPCRPRGKEPLTHHGVKDATTDPAQINHWWQRWPDANVAIATGAASGIIALDVDLRHGGGVSLDLLEFEHEPLPETAVQHTPAGGRHYLFRHPGGAIKNSTSEIGAGLDIKADGGYILVAPSVGANGKVYEFEVEHSLDEIELASVPAWLLAKLRASKNGNRSAQTEEEPIEEGARNHILFRLGSSMRAKGMSSAAILAALLAENAARCRPPLDEDEVQKIAASASKYEPGKVHARATQSGEDLSGQDERPNPWLLAKPAPALLAEEEKEFRGLAKDVLAPGAITLFAAPRGLGKTQVSHALAVALATGGVFRAERVQAARVLLLDRDNPEAIIKKRLRAWGAHAANNLYVLTRQNAPDLKDRKAWELFPARAYDVLIVDSVGSATEGVTEKEGKQTTEVLATVLDLARQGLAILLLQNTIKDGSTVKGRGEWSDRADIVFEVRDATGFTPSGKRPWWQELPDAGEAAWAERAARRKGRIDFRLAFVPSKFRIGLEPEPFCLELHLPATEPWTLTDVTRDIQEAAAATLRATEDAKTEAMKTAAAALAEVVRVRAATEDPLLKTEAEEYLHTEQSLARDAARAVITEYAGALWRIEPVESRKGRPKALWPPSHPGEPRKSDRADRPHGTSHSATPISAAPDFKPRENNHPLQPAPDGHSSNTLFSRAEDNTTAEIGAQQSPKNQPCRDSLIFADAGGETATDEETV